MVVPILVPILMDLVLMISSITPLDHLRGWGVAVVAAVHPSTTSNQTPRENSGENFKPVNEYHLETTGRKNSRFRFEIVTSEDTETIVDGLD